jgi:hypothetical protein
MKHDPLPPLVITSNRGHAYTPEQIDAALFACAALNGNTRAASRQLADAGILRNQDNEPIPWATIQGWKSRTYKDRYLMIRERLVPQIKAEMAERQEEAVMHGMDLQAKIRERLETEIPELKPQDLGKTLQQVGITTGINSQRAGENRGDATVIERRVDISEALAGLKRLGVIESTGEEIQDAQLEEAS